MARKWGFGFGPKTGKKHLKKARKAGDPTPPFSTPKRGFGFRPKTNNKHFQKARKEETQPPLFGPKKGVWVQTRNMSCGLRMLLGGVLL